MELARTWLQLYLARLRAGEVQQAGAELGQRLASDPKHARPAPGGPGHPDGPALLSAAGQEEVLAAARRRPRRRRPSQEHGPGRDASMQGAGGVIIGAPGA